MSVPIAQPRGTNTPISQLRGAGTLTPSPAVASLRAYVPTRHAAPCDLDLAGTEGSRAPDGSTREMPTAWSESLTRYPDASAVAAQLAQLYGVTPDRVLVTAGADAVVRVWRQLSTDSGAKKREGMPMARP